MDHVITALYCILHWVHPHILHWFEFTPIFCIDLCSPPCFALNSPTYFASSCIPQLWHSCQCLVVNSTEIWEIWCNAASPGSILPLLALCSVNIALHYTHNIADQYSVQYVNNVASIHQTVVHFAEPQTILFDFQADIGKTFGPLPDRRTGNHMENPSFTGPPKFLQDLIFFNIRILIEGLPTGIFLTDRRTGTIRVFIGPPLFSPVEDRGPVDFPMSVQVCV